LPSLYAFVIHAHANVIAPSNLRLIVQLVAAVKANRTRRKRVVTGIANLSGLALTYINRHRV
jgi:hypothetical protein